MQTIPFRIIDIKVEDFKLFPASLDKGERIDVRTDFEFGANKDAHAVICRIKYTYSQHVKELMRMCLVCVFDVKPEEFAGLITGDRLIIDSYFAQYLATINVGAARGEIHARCELNNSPLANVILPPINLVEALPEKIEIVFDISD